MSEKIIASFAGTFDDFINDFTQVVFKFVLWHEHDEDAEGLHDCDFDSDVFVLVLFDETGDDVWVEIIDGVSVGSGFDQL